MMRKIWISGRVMKFWLEVLLCLLVLARSIIIVLLGRLFLCFFFPR